MCKGSALIAVDCNGVEGACGGREVLSIGLLMRLRSDRGQSCKQVSGQAHECHFHSVSGIIASTQG